MVNFAILALTLISVAHAAPAVAAPLRGFDQPLKSDLTLQGQLRLELQARSGTDFSTTLSRWRIRYGKKASPALRKLARDASLKDHHRYVALMGAVKLTSPHENAWVSEFLSDPSWMLRSGALKAMQSLHATSLATRAFPLLKDPALVVRSEAVRTLQLLRPPGYKTALERVLNDPRNYQGSKPLWIIPQTRKVLSQAKTG